jgi:hypothetical protein
VPQGTGKSHQKQDAESGMQDIHRSMFVSIKDRSTSRTDVGTDRETLFDPCTTAGAILRGELRENGNNRDGMDSCIVLHSQ